MAIRIQLASNFQVVELSYENFNCINEEEINAATELVNKLGREVINEVKTAKKAGKPIKKASESQIKYAVSLGLDEDEAREMDSKEVFEYIKKHKDD